MYLARVLQGGTLLPFLLVIIVDCILRNNILETVEDVDFNKTEEAQNVPRYKNYWSQLRWRHGTAVWK